MGYVTTSEGFDVFYGKAYYCFLADALPEGTTESEYAGALNYPAVIEYAGKQYENGPDGYYYLGSVEQTGMKYSVKVDGENVRIAAARKFTEEECPDSFEKLPEVDDDLKSIMSDIAELVKKYGPEIPDEVKNGTTKGTTCQYKPTKDSYYVAIGDDTAAVKDSYVNLLADGLKLSYKNLSEPEMRIEHADKAFLEANTSEIEKADLITIGFSVNGFATVAVEEALKNMDSSSSLIPWDRYLPEEAVPEIASIRERMKQYLIDNGMDGQLMGVPLRDALVTVAESLAFDTLAYINELPRLIDDIREINGNAQIVVVGMDNPMESSTLSLGADEKIELGVYVDQLINNMDNASQAVAIEKENTVFVSAPDALNKNDNKELTENALILSYINGIKSQAIPDEKGQAYIRNQIIKSMRKMGDVNSDGQVNYNDALVILRASINLVTLSEEDMLFADVDGKDGISYNDALKILRASIGLDTLD